MDIANLGMANVALPTIQKELGYDEGSLQWILTAYSLTVRQHFPLRDFCTLLQN